MCLPLTGDDGVVCVADPNRNGWVERRLPGILDHTLVAVFVADADLRLRYVNAAYARLHGRTREELLGLPLIAVVPPERLEQFREILHLLLECRQAMGTSLPSVVTRVRSTAAPRLCLDPETGLPSFATGLATQSSLGTRLQNFCWMENGR